MRLGALIAMLLFALSARAQDRHLVPVPRPILPLFSENPYHNNNLQNSDEDKRGSENVPLIVKVIPSDPSPGDRERGNEKAELDRKLTDYTGDLAFYTKTLFGATGVLAIVTGWLAFVASRQTREARRSIIAAEKSAKIAERALVELEAPFVTLKILKPGLTAEHQSRPPGSPHWSIAFGNMEYVFTNQGRTVAQLISYHVDFQIVSENDPITKPINPSTAKTNALPAGIFVMPGSNSDPRYRLMAGPAAHNPKEQALHLIGFVKYADIFGNRYVSGFCFEFSPVANVFILIGGDAYNYRCREDDIATKSFEPEQ